MKKYMRKITYFIILFFISFVCLSENVTAAPTEEQCNELTCFCDNNGDNCILGESASGSSNVPYTDDKCGCNTYTADDIGAVNYSVCNDERILNIFRIIGFVIVAAKIVAPLLLIIFGIVELSKAVIASDDKAISSATGLLAKKAVAAVVIFFIPTVVDFVYSVVNSAKPIEETFMKCQKCLVDPQGDICTEGMKDYEANH